MLSAVVRSFAYSPEARELTIEFTTGRTYRYSSVPPHAADAFRAAFSKGRHFNRHLRDLYDCEEL